MNCMKLPMAQPSMKPGTVLLPQQAMKLSTKPLFG
jgi:hypothetical protein